MIPSPQGKGKGDPPGSVLNDFNRALDPRNQDPVQVQVRPSEGARILVLDLVRDS
jgi:hypothetical protein